MTNDFSLRYMEWKIIFANPEGFFVARRLNVTVESIIELSRRDARVENKILTLCLETYGRSRCRTKSRVTLNLAVTYRERERERESQVQTKCFGLSASQFLFVKLTSGERQMLIFVGNFTASFKPFDNGLLVLLSLINRLLS